MFDLYDTYSIGDMSFYKSPIPKPNIRTGEGRRVKLRLGSKKQADQIIADAQAKIQKDKESAIQEIRQEVAQLSISIAEKVLKKELSDKKAQNAYIETLLKEKSV